MVNFRNKHFTQQAPVGDGVYMDYKGDYYLDGTLIDGVNPNREALYLSAFPSFSRLDRVDYELDNDNELKGTLEQLRKVVNFKRLK